MPRKAIDILRSLGWVIGEAVQDSAETTETVENAESSEVTTNNSDETKAETNTEATEVAFENIAEYLDHLGFIAENRRVDVQSIVLEAAIGGEKLNGDIPNVVYYDEKNGGGMMTYGKGMTADDGSRYDPETKINSSYYYIDFTIETDNLNLPLGADFGDEIEKIFGVLGFDVNDIANLSAGNSVLLSSDEGCKYDCYLSYNKQTTLRYTDTKDVVKADGEEVLVIRQVSLTFADSDGALCLKSACVSLTCESVIE